MTKFLLNLESTDEKDPKNLYILKAILANTNVNAYNA